MNEKVVLDFDNAVLIEKLVRQIKDLRFELEHTQIRADDFRKANEEIQELRNNLDTAIQALNTIEWMQSSLSGQAVMVAKQALAALKKWTGKK